MNVAMPQCTSFVVDSLDRTDIESNAFPLVAMRTNKTSSSTAHIDFKSRFWDILMDLFDATVWSINGHVDVEYIAVCQINVLRALWNTPPKHFKWRKNLE